MTGKEFVFSVLQDGQPHTIEEIELRSPARITVHSRVADLRNDGHEIRRVVEGRVTGYQWLGKRKGRTRVRPRLARVVQGYIFQSVADDPRNGNVCQIEERANASDHEVLENGPAFKVRFGDGEADIVFSNELRPWYPI